MTAQTVKLSSTPFTPTLEKVTLLPEEQEFRDRSLPGDEGIYKTQLVVPDMHCVGCVSKVERALNALPHVQSARANLSMRRVEVLWDGCNAQGIEIEKELNDLGFDNFIYGGDEDATSHLADEGKRLLVALGVAGFAAANIMLLSVSVWSGASDETARLFHLISALIAVPAVAIAGRPFFSSAGKALAARRLNMDVPISLAVLLALLMGVYETLTGGHEVYFDACVTLLFFLLIGRYLDHLMRQKARSSVESLARITQKGGLRLKDDGAVEFVPQDEIKVGYLLRVLPGERFPVDGVIKTGTSELDRSLVTGESESIEAGVDDTVEAGVLNLTGVIDFVATTDSRNSFTAEIMKMMTAAEKGRSRYVRIAERAATIYAPAVHLLALITFIGWMIVTAGDWRSSLYASVAVLIITCPCALGLAVPVVHVIGANRLLREGILMRDGSAFERLAEIDTVAFDKTGTLTQGVPHWVSGDTLSDEDTNIIATLARNTSHPAARALTKRFSDASGVSLSNMSEHAGLGVEATYKGQLVRLGRPGWVSEFGRKKSTGGQSATLGFCREHQAPAMFKLADAVLPSAPPAVAKLQDEGLNTEILSGDRISAVTAVADQTGIDTFFHDLTPSQKVARLELHRNHQRKALMVGDGLNDGPALASAHVSMAPSTASEVGRQASDFVYTRGSLLAVPFSHSIAKRTKSLIQQNFAIAIAYNCIAVPLAMTGYVTPLVAAIAMSTSSILVVANSMRLSVDWSSTTDSKQTKLKGHELTRVGQFAQSKAVS